MIEKNENKPFPETQRNGTEMQPYRSSEMVHLKANLPPLYGLLLAPKPQPKHTCQLQGVFGRLFSGIRVGTLYRCPVCFAIWELQDYINAIFIFDFAGWKQVSNKKWLKAGGQLEENAKELLGKYALAAEEEDEEYDEDDEEDDDE